MTDPETPTQPLLGQTAVNVGAPEQGPRSTRAYKVAGLTLVACVLILSQAAIAYFLLSQNNDIRNLEEQNNKLNTQLTSGRSASIPMRAHMAMNPAFEIMDTSMEEVESRGTEKTSTPSPNAKRKMLVWKRRRCPGSIPNVTGRVSMSPSSASIRHAGVNPANGEPIPGRTDCNSSAFSGDRMMLTKDVVMEDA